MTFVTKNLRIFYIVCTVAVRLFSVRLPIIIVFTTARFIRLSIFLLSVENYLDFANLFPIYIYNRGKYICVHIYIYIHKHIVDTDRERVRESVLLQLFLLHAPHQKEIERSRKHV